MQQRHILLLVDDAPAHPVVNDLTNVQVQFLPKNTTGLVQPLDAGVIQKFKGFHRAELTNKILNLLEIDPDVSAEALLKKIDIFLSLGMMNWAWHSVKRKTITNCFKHAFSYAPTDDEKTLNKKKLFDPLGDVPLSRNMDKGTFQELVNEDIAEGREQAEEGNTMIQVKMKMKKNSRISLKKMPQRTALLPLGPFVSFVSNSLKTSLKMQKYNVNMFLRKHEICPDPKEIMSWKLHYMSLGKDKMCSFFQLKILF